MPIAVATFLVLLIVAALAAGMPGGAQAGQVPASLVPMLQARKDIAFALSEPIARCVVRTDTAHPAFHGCVDWHSAVHGTWALVAYTSMTGDARYEPIIRSLLTPEKIAAERLWLRQNAEFELPYGRAWFLRLGIEHERHYRDRRLTAMADDVAASLLAHYTRNPPEPRAASYQNASWALINLLDYYEFRGHADLAANVRRIIAGAFLEPDETCSLKNDRNGFMAVCTNWAWVASKVVSRTDFPAWMRRLVPQGELPVPVTDPSTDHEHGLNFSRSWGLLELYAVTGDAGFVDSYVEHFNATYGQRANWDGDYRAVGHWVAQFGMLAVQPLFSGRFQ